MPAPVATNFEECAAAGNPIMESYPRQCRQGNQSFIENIGNEFEKANLIRIDSPRPNQSVQSPLTIKGEARGNWFFEASFPVILTDWDGRIIAQGIATAKGDWMTTEFVSYEAILTFTVDKNAYSNRGSLILRKDNPSGLPANDDALEIPVTFADIKGSDQPTACTMEAKLCPDGSYVGRTGANCEFAACPNATATGTGTGTILPYDSGISGTVMLGPTCPVQRIPPDPNCADKPYQTSITVFRTGDLANAFLSVNSDIDGKFSVSLPPGEYTLSAGKNILPRCDRPQITVSPHAFVSTTITCDTGIR